MMPYLVPGDVHVWIAQLDSPGVTAAAKDILSPEELERARRFLFEKDRTAYIFAHLALRDILGRYLNRNARDLLFERGPYGKPFLVDGFTPHFNLSHSGSLVLVAIACDQQIGVDVEEVRALTDLEGIARSHFTPDECAFVLGQEGAARQQAFYRCWTRKESYIKAIGKGLSVPLNSFDTLLPQLEDPESGGSWCVTDLEVPAGYMGAVTVERGLVRLSYSHWPSASVP